MSLFEGRVHLLQFVFLKDSENTCSWFFFLYEQEKVHIKMIILWLN